MAHVRSKYPVLELRRQPIRPLTRIRCALAVVGLLIGVTLASLPIFANPTPCAAPDAASIVSVAAQRDSDAFTAVCY